MSRTTFNGSQLRFVLLVLLLATIACQVDPNALEDLSTAIAVTPDSSDNGEVSDGDNAPEADPNRVEPDEEYTFDAPDAIVMPEGLAIDLTGVEEALSGIYRQVNGGVVNIEVSAEQADGGLQDIGTGSGFVIDAGGLIATNSHVVEDADAIRVTFADGLVLDADLIGRDPFADLAIIDVDPPDGYSMTVLAMGDSDVVDVGDLVIAIGNPFGLEGSMTVGYISAAGRSLPTGVTSSGVFSNPRIIQVDAVINPGNSGGPLLNSSGEVIAINTAISTETGVFSGVGFAVPVNTLKHILPQMIDQGFVEYPYLGISSQTDVTLAELATEFEVPVLEGVLVSTVEAGGPAEQAGLQGGDELIDYRGHNVTLGGDIIIAIDGTAVRDFGELIGYLAFETSIGDEVILTVVRDDQTLELPLIVGTRPGAN